MKLRRKLNKGCVLLFAIPFLILISLLLFAQWVWSGSIKPSLDPQFVPTAEYLLEHPQPTPSFLSVSPAPALRMDNQLSALRIEVNLEANKFDTSQWTQIFLNGQRLEHLDTTGSFPGGLPAPNEKNSNTAYFYIYHTATLHSGLYLLRIQAGSSFHDFLNPDPKLSYEWAYRVE
jgi:hypothetical protein